MLDVKFIRENLELVEKSAKEKGYKIDIRKVLELDDKRKAELVEVEELRRKRNEIAAKMKGSNATSRALITRCSVKNIIYDLKGELKIKVGLEKK